MSKKTASAVALVALCGALTVGCDTGPDCKRGHIQVTLVPSYNAATKTSTVRQVQTYICDEYEKESKS